MSEKIETQPLDITAFVLAMIGGPLLVTLCTFWALFIPVVALVIGGIPYLAIGTPMALWMALTGPVTFARGAVWGGLTIVVITAGTILIDAIITQTADGAALTAFGMMAAAFAMLWAGTSAWIYGAMTTPKTP